MYTSQAFSHKIEAKVQAELKEKAAKDKKIKLETAPLRRNEETII